ncbi:MAG: S-methyl-5'-thioadenosine phosphorylase [Candidatus Omnitrophota bacterium]
MGKIGIIGGSALYTIEGFETRERKKVKTPFGDPSDEFVLGTFAGQECVFLPRHGHEHTILPSELNYRANIYAFKILGVDRIISISAVGSLKEEIRPLDIVLADQFIDRTNQGRQTTFFGEGMVAHVSLAEPVCQELKEIIYNNSADLNLRMHDGGTYLNMEGPAFSTKAESYLYKSWGVDIIGMTNMPEARLAREAGICYVTIAMVTDYDSWYLGPEIENVSVEMVIANLKKNIETAKNILHNIIPKIPEVRNCMCKNALRDAIVTRKEAVPKKTLEKLKPILDGVI